MSKTKPDFHKKARTLHPCSSDRPYHSLINELKDGPKGFLQVFSDPLDAKNLGECKGYWILWKFKRNIRGYKKHVITHAEIDGLEVNTAQWGKFEKGVNHHEKNIFRNF